MAKEPKELQIGSCVEIGNLIDVISERTGKSWRETEKQAFEDSCYPESHNPYVDVRWPNENDGWFTKEVQAILKEKNLVRIHIYLDI